MNMQVTINDGDDSYSKITLSESRDGNVAIKVETYRSDGLIIVKPDELLRAARLFVTTNTGDLDT